MATITTEVEVDLDEFNLDEILEEIENRYYGSNKVFIDEWLNSFFKLGTNTLSLLDEMKIDFIKKNIDKIKLTDLENLI